MAIALTICLAIKCKKSEEDVEKPVLLFASDTQESTQYLKREVTKMRTIFGKDPRKKGIEKWGILVASAGDSLVIDEVISDIGAFLRDEISSAELRPSIRLRDLRKEIGDLAYSVYEKYSERNCGYSEFEMLFGAADMDATMLYVTFEGKQEVLDQFRIIGSGQVTGGELLLNEFMKEDMTQEEAANLAALIVTRIGNVDQFVSGEPDIQWCRNRRVWHYKDIKFTKIMIESEGRWNLIKKAWSRMQEDNTIRKKIQRALQDY